MSLKALSPTAPITNEAEAREASKASAVSIMVGVVVGIVSLVYTLMNPQILEAAIAEAAAQAPETATMMEASAQAGLWMSVGLIVIQAIFAFIQWRSAKKWIAILFMVLIGLGILMTAATPLMAGMSPGTVTPPVWQVVVAIAIMIVQLILHIAGLRGINRLEEYQMQAAR